MNRSALDRIWAKFKALIWADSINSIPYSNPIHRLVRWSKRCTFHLSWIITFAFPFASYLKNHSTDQRIAFYRIQPSKRRESNSRDNNDTEIQRWFGTVSSVPCLWTFIVDFVFPVDSSQKKNREKKTHSIPEYIFNKFCMFFFLSLFFPPLSVVKNPFTTHLDCNLTVYKRNKKKQLCLCVYFIFCLSALMWWPPTKKKNLPQNASNFVCK